MGDHEREAARAGDGDDVEEVEAGEADAGTRSEEVERAQEREAEAAEG